MSTPLAPEIEITKDVGLTEEKAALMDMHSFLNVLNVLVGELSLIILAADNPESLSKTRELAYEVKALLSAKEKHRALGEQLFAIENRFAADLAALLASQPALANDPEIQESVANVRSVIEVLTTRVTEFLARLDRPDAWEPHSVAKLTDNFRNFFAAVEKNSKGRYRIIYNIAAQEPSDYVVNLSIQSVEGDILKMPPVLQDVFRDLIANARKYTPPGGIINAGLRDDGKQITLVVEDNGMGIPTDEIEKVVDFGYRATNARDRRTCGDGFGLTKAYATVRRFNGRFWIKSSVGAGTKITIRIPRPS